MTSALTSDNGDTIISNAKSTKTHENDHVGGPTVLIISGDNHGSKPILEMVAAYKNPDAKKKKTLEKLLRDSKKMEWDYLPTPLPQEVTVTPESLKTLRAAEQDLWRWKLDRPCVNLANEENNYYFSIPVEENEDNEDEEDDQP